MSSFKASATITRLASVLKHSLCATGFSLAVSVLSTQAHAGCQYVVTNDWGSGYTALIKITNSGTTTINGWTVRWQYSGNNRVTNVWNTRLTGSNPYSGTNLSWNANIQPNQTVEFGFQGTKSTAAAEIPVVTGTGCGAASTSRSSSSHFSSISRSSSSISSSRSSSLSRSSSSSSRSSSSVSTSRSSSSRSSSSSSSKNAFPPLGAVSCKLTCGAAVCGDDGCGGVCGTCDVDSLCSAGACTKAPVGNDVIVNTGTITHKINRDIYGGAFANTASFQKHKVTLNRYGGNGSTRYNHQNNRSNAAADWYFLSGDEKSEGVKGSDSYYNYIDLVVRDSLAANATTLVTIPTIGWTTKDAEGATKHCGYPRANFPEQNSFWVCGGATWCAADCGDGKTLDKKEIPASEWQATLTSKKVDARFAADRVTHLVNRFGSAYTDRTHYYQLDNEITLWSSTHRDIHPAKVTFKEIWDKTVEYAPAIREADPKGRILGYGTFAVMDVADTGGDRKNYNNITLMEWYLQQLAAYEKQNGKRLIDCIDLHYYPILDEKIEANVLNAARPLWDTTFLLPKDDWQQYLFSSHNIKLLPRVRSWIQKNYPGTGICLSEYNLHKENPLSALVHAEALGVFGKEGLTLASYWGMGDWDKKDDPRHWPQFSYKMFLNYDGQGNGFGDDSLSTAVTTNTENLIAFASRRSKDNAITLLLINKGTVDLVPTVNLRNAKASIAKTWVYKVNDMSISNSEQIAINSEYMNVSVPARSMKMIEIK
jgi:Glycoside hydrolase family 44/Cellulose binding domain